MRHNKSGRKFGLVAERRKALFRNLAKSLVDHERIRTTEPKAKELSKVADRLVTLALRNDLHARRQAYKVLGSHTLVQKLFDEIGPRFVGIQGGFTRVVKTSLPRRGDAAPMAYIEFALQAGETAPEPKAKKKATAAAQPDLSAAPVGTEEPAPEETMEPAEAQHQAAGAPVEEAVEEATPAEAAEPAQAAPAEEASTEEPADVETPEEQLHATPEAPVAEAADEATPPEGAEAETPADDEKKQD
jgi:large subunit ribosomal protein L17